MNRVLTLSIMEFRPVDTGILHATPRTRSVDDSVDHQTAHSKKSRTEQI